VPDDICDKQKHVVEGYTNHVSAVVYVRGCLLQICLNFQCMKYEACPESKDTKVLNMYNIFNLQKRHYEWIACT